MKEIFQVYKVHKTFNCFSTVMKGNSLHYLFPHKDIYRRRVGNLFDIHNSEISLRIIL